MIIYEYIHYVCSTTNNPPMDLPCHVSWERPSRQRGMTTPCRSGCSWRLRRRGPTPPPLLLCAFDRRTGHGPDTDILNSDEQCRVQWPPLPAVHGCTTVSIKTNNYKQLQQLQTKSYYPPWWYESTEEKGELRIPPPVTSLSLFYQPSVYFIWKHKTKHIR